MTTINQALNEARQKLRASSPSPAVDASILLSHAMGCSTTHLIAWPDKTLSQIHENTFNDLLQQRIEGKPVAYITGKKEFWSLTLSVTGDVLIPRPETETLIEFVMETFAGRNSMKVADLGTGSGAIACALALEHPQWDIIATDLSTAALDVARYNASAHKLDNIHFLHSRWFEAIADHDFDLIISNPPYVALDDPHLSAGDVRFEPESALTSGERGMDAITLLTRQSADYLSPDGWLIVEHGYDQQQAVADCFKQGGFEHIVQLTDLAGLPRMTAGQCVESNA